MMPLLQLAVGRTHRVVLLSVGRSLSAMATEFKSDAEHVREFTGGAGQPTPDRPEPMTDSETKFIAKMIIDETLELLATIMPPTEQKATLKAMIDAAKDVPQDRFEHGDATRNAIDKAAAQADALVDIYYYSQNAACKKGMNLSSVFGLVHAANMAKRDPETGQFLKRADGKIIKPAGWTAPDVEGEIARQHREGAWGKAMFAFGDAENSGTAAVNGGR